MNLQKYKKFGLLLLLIQFLEVRTAYSQDSLDSLNDKLASSLEQKNRLIEADQKARVFISDYQELIVDFEKNATSFQQTKKVIEATLVQRQKAIADISRFINEKIPHVMNPIAKPTEINGIWHDFRSLRQQKNPCDEDSTLDSFADAVVLAGRLDDHRIALQKLVTDTVLPPEHKALVDAVRHGVEMAKTSAANVELFMNAYGAALAQPKVCDLFRNFDVIVALASAAAEANAAAAEIDKIDINGFLAKIDAVSAANKALTTTRRMLTSLDATLVRSIRSGYLGRTLRYAGTYKESLSAITDPVLGSALFSDSEKTEIRSKLAEVKTNIERELKNARLTESEGRRNFLLTRGRNLYATVGRINRDLSLPDPDARKKEIVNYCKTNLGMAFPGRYLVPSTPMLETEAELDRKFEVADAMIFVLEGK